MFPECVDVLLVSKLLLCTDLWDDKKLDLLFMFFFLIVKGYSFKF